MKLPRQYLKTARSVVAVRKECSGELLGFTKALEAGLCGAAILAWVWAHPSERSPARDRPRERYFNEPVGRPAHGLLLAPTRVPLPPVRLHADPGWLRRHRRLDGRSVAEPGYPQGPMTTWLPMTGGVGG